VRAPDQAVSQAYRAYGPFLINYLLGLTQGDRHKAEDILQETLVRAWQHPEAVQEDGVWSKAWLFTVARNIAIDHIRAQRIRPVELADHYVSDEAGVDDRLERLLESTEVHAAVQALPARLRDVLVELYFGQQSVGEVARILGIPEGTVKSRCFYAIKALREELAARGFPFPPPRRR
jgi:RNA polymerase sigma-70 factor, ECF subfamily